MCQDANFQVQGNDSQVDPEPEEAPDPVLATTNNNKKHIIHCKGNLHTFVHCLHPFIQVLKMFGRTYFLSSGELGLIHNLYNFTKVKHSNILIKYLALGLEFIYSCFL